MQVWYKLILLDLLKVWALINRFSEDVLISRALDSPASSKTNWTLVWVLSLVVAVLLLAILSLCIYICSNKYCTVHTLTKIFVIPFQ